ncbi:MAG: septal ring lytic transglycosylase RlpA family protein [Limnothrix sp. RL_2_0]|nr:septal ring lytic transglycosylase RlpA family protein [Limnothrix sp. RL_2_0]
MRLLKLKGFLSAFGASVVVGVGGIMSSSPVMEVEASEAKHHGGTPQATIAQTISPSVELAEPVAQESGEKVASTTTAAGTNLELQRENLAENALCRLASETEENPPEVFQGNTVAETPSRFSNFVSSFLRKVVSAMGLERLFQPQSVPTTKVAVVPKSSGESSGAIADQEAQTNSTTTFVSNTTNALSTDVDEYELWVKGHLIANIRTQNKVNLLAQRLERLVETSSFNAAAITPMIHDGKPAIAMGEQILFVIDESITFAESKNYEILAIRWANNLRLAFEVPALDLVTAQTQMYQIEETSQSLEGLASWYGPYFHGRLTANGEIYDQFALTAAHPSMPLDSYLKITNLNNEKSVIIRLNDRGPYIKPRSLDLSLGAARCLDSVEKGVIPYKATIMERRPAIATEAI